MLVLNFTVYQSSDCTKFYFKDTTGTYDPISNPTGWGNPNDDILTAQTPIELEITTPDSNTYTIDLVTTTPIFPVDSPPDTLELTMADIGGVLGDKIPDGIYSFKYTVTTASGTYEQYLTTAFTCQVCCCVLSMVKEVKAGCDCCDQDITKIMEAWLLYQGLLADANCGNTVEFNNTLDILQKICKNSKCNNCK